MAGGRVLVVRCDWAGHAAPEELLGDRERAHAARLRGPRRTEWVRTRLTAKAAVRRATGESGAELLPDRHGAPHLVSGPPAMTVSLAHTGSLAVCALSPGSGAGERGGDGIRGGAGVRSGAGVVGVDVEPFDPRNAVLLPRLLAPGEYPELFGDLSPGARATVLVSCKEAALKAYRGASRSLRDHRLWRCAHGTLWVRSAVPGASDLRVFLSYGAGLVTAVCHPGPRAPHCLSATPDQVLRALRPGPRRTRPTRRREEER